MSSGDSPRVAEPQSARLPLGPKPSSSRAGVLRSFRLGLSAKEEFVLVDGQLSGPALPDDSAAVRVVRVGGGSAFRRLGRSFGRAGGHARGLDAVPTYDLVQHHRSALGSSSVFLSPSSSSPELQEGGVLATWKGPVLLVSKTIHAGGSKKTLVNFQLQYITSTAATPIAATSAVPSTAAAAASLKVLEGPEAATEAAAPGGLPAVASAPLPPPRQPLELEWRAVPGVMADASLDLTKYLNSRESSPAAADLMWPTRVHTRSSADGTVDGRFSAYVLKMLVVHVAPDNAAGIGWRRVISGRSGLLPLPFGRLAPGPESPLTPGAASSPSRSHSYSRSRSRSHSRSRSRNNLPSSTSSPRSDVTTASLPPLETEYPAAEAAKEADEEGQRADLLERDALAPAEAEAVAVAEAEEPPLPSPRGLEAAQSGLPTAAAATTGGSGEAPAGTCTAPDSGTDASGGYGGGVAVGPGNDGVASRCGTGRRAAASTPLDEAGSPVEEQVTAKVTAVAAVPRKLCDMGGVARLGDPGTAAAAAATEPPISPPPLSHPVAATAAEVAEVYRGAAEAAPAAARKVFPGEMLRALQQVSQPTPLPPGHAAPLHPATIVAAEAVAAMAAAAAVAAGKFNDATRPPPSGPAAVRSESPAHPARVATPVEGLQAAGPIGGKTSEHIGAMRAKPGKSPMGRQPDGAGEAPLSTQPTPPTRAILNTNPDAAAQFEKLEPPPSPSPPEMEEPSPETDMEIAPQDHPIVGSLELKSGLGLRPEDFGAAAAVEALRIAREAAAMPVALPVLLCRSGSGSLGRDGGGNRSATPAAARPSPLSSGGSISAPCNAAAWHYGVGGFRGGCMDETATSSMFSDLASPGAGPLHSNTGGGGAAAAASTVIRFGGAGSADRRRTAMPVKVSSAGVPGVGALARTEEAGNVTHGTAGAVEQDSAAESSAFPSDTAATAATAGAGMWVGAAASRATPSPALHMPVLHAQALGQAAATAPAVATMGTDSAAGRGDGGGSGCGNRSSVGDAVDKGGGASASFGSVFVDGDAAGSCNAADHASEARDRTWLRGAYGNGTNNVVDSRGGRSAQANPPSSGLVIKPSGEITGVLDLYHTPVAIGPELTSPRTAPQSQPPPWPLMQPPAVRDLYDTCTLGGAAAPPLLPAVPGNGASSSAVALAGFEVMRAVLSGDPEAISKAAAWKLEAEAVAWVGAGAAWCLGDQAWVNEQPTPRAAGTVAAAAGPDTERSSSGVTWRRLPADLTQEDGTTTTTTSAEGCCDVSLGSAASELLAGTTAPAAAPTHKADTADMAAPAAPAAATVGLTAAAGAVVTAMDAADGGGPARGPSRLRALHARPRRTAVRRQSHPVARPLTFLEPVPEGSEIKEGSDPLPVSFFSLLPSPTHTDTAHDDFFSEPGFIFASGLLEADAGDSPQPGSCDPRSTSEQQRQQRWRAWHQWPGGDTLTATMAAAAAPPPSTAVAGRPGGGSAGAADAEQLLRDALLPAAIHHTDQWVAAPRSVPVRDMAILRAQNSGIEAGGESSEAEAEEEEDTAAQAGSSVESEERAEAELDELLAQAAATPQEVKEEAGSSGVLPRRGADVVRCSRGCGDTDDAGKATTASTMAAGGAAAATATPRVVVEEEQQQEDQEEDIGEDNEGRAAAAAAAAGTRRRAPLATTGDGAASGGAGLGGWEGEIPWRILASERHLEPLSKMVCSSPSTAGGAACGSDSAVIATDPRVSYALAGLPAIAGDHAEARHASRSEDPSRNSASRSAQLQTTALPTSLPFAHLEAVPQLDPLAMHCSADIGDTAATDGDAVGAQYTATVHVSSEQLHDVVDLQQKLLASSHDVLPGRSLSAGAQLAAAVAPASPGRILAAGARLSSISSAPAGVRSYFAGVNTRRFSHTGGDTGWDVGAAAAQEANYAGSGDGGSLTALSPEGASALAAAVLRSREREAVAEGGGRLVGGGGVREELQQLWWRRRRRLRPAAREGWLGWWPAVQVEKVLVMGAASMVCVATELLEVVSQDQPPAPYGPEEGLAAVPLLRPHAALWAHLPWPMASAAHAGWTALLALACSALAAVDLMRRSLGLSGLVPVVP